MLLLFSYMQCFSTASTNCTCKAMYSIAEATKGDQPGLKLQSELELTTLDKKMRLVLEWVTPPRNHF